MLTIELVEGSERVERNVNEDLIFVSVALYEAFLVRCQYKPKKGEESKPGQGSMDAYVLFSHLCYSGIKQDTNSVWANRKYLKNGLRWGQGRVDAAMAILTEMKLVTVKGHGEHEKFGKSYIQVHRTFLPPKRIEQVDSRQVNLGSTNSGQVDPDQAAWNRSTNCLNKESNASAGEAKKAEKKERAPRKYAFAFNPDTGKFEGISDEQVEQWQSSYPALDIEQELVNMADWLKANGLKKNYPRFVVGWLIRGQGGRRAS